MRGYIRMNLREIEWDAVDWIHLAEDRDQWWAVVNTVMTLLFLQKAMCFLTI
jgi:hypothetical protein